MPDKRSVVGSPSPGRFVEGRARDCREPTKCRDCNEQVLWVTWPRSGKRMPINAEPKPAPYGQVLVTWRKDTNELLAEVAREGDAPGRKLYESHFATCTSERATQMRKNRPPQGSARRTA